MQLMAQQKTFWLHGMIRDTANVIKDVHIINLNTAKGTFSNDYGQYRMVVSVGDTLEFTSVQHETVKKVITDQIAFSKKLNVVLKNKTYVLDEVVLKNHDLTGNLLIDRKKAPGKDTIAKITENMEDLIVDLASKSTQRIDPAERGTAKTTLRNTDPTRSFKGVGGAISLGSKKRKKEKLRKITSNTFTTKNVIDKVGIDLFIQLKIPEEQIYNFVDFCKKFKIQQLFQQQKFLEMTEVFKEKSTLFLKQLKD